MMGGEECPNISVSLCSVPARVRSSHHGTMADRGGHRAFQARRKCKNLFADCSNTAGEFRDTEQQLQDHQLRSHNYYRLILLTPALLCHTDTSSHQKPSTMSISRLSPIILDPFCARKPDVIKTHCLELRPYGIRNLASATSGWSGWSGQARGNDNICPPGQSCLLSPCRSVISGWSLWSFSPPSQSLSSSSTPSSSSAGNWYQDDSHW